MDSESRKKLDLVLYKLKQLPTLPVIYKRLMEVMENQRVSAQLVGAVIEQDQAIASKLLRVVNSAYYGFSRRISTISQAVVILGFNEIKHLALSISIIHAMGKVADEKLFNYADFWRHSIGVAICSGVLSKKIGVTKCGSHEEAFVAGLLHDIGKIIEEQFFHEKYFEALQLSEATSTRLFENEKNVLSFTHEETGEYLLDYWKLPQNLVTAAGFHHSPDSKRNTAVYASVSITHIADILCRSLGFGNGGDVFVPPLNKFCWEFTELTTDVLEPMLAEIERSYEEMSKFLLI